MAYEKRDNSGSLFKNNRKQRDNDPTLTGSVMVDGKEYWINGWTKTKPDGDKWISLSIRAKEQRDTAHSQSVSSEDIPF